MTTSANIGHMSARMAAALVIFVASSASAQTQPSALDLRLPELRPQMDPAAASADENAADSATSVHGSVSTGVGYSKNYGNSTVTAAELDVNKQYEDGKALNLHIDVFRATGLPNVAPRDYVSRYPGY